MLFFKTGDIGDRITKYHAPLRIKSSPIVIKIGDMLETHWRHKLFKGSESMILQIHCGDNLIRDVLCMKYEYENYIASLELSSIPYTTVKNCVEEGMRTIAINVENTTFIEDYFY